MGAHSLRLTPTNALSNICLTLYVLNVLLIISHIPPTWKKQVVNALDRGLEINTLSVFNKSIQFDGYQNTFVKLMRLVKPIIKSENSFMLVECSSYIPVLSFLIFF
jgi:hypothetical protein